MKVETQTNTNPLELAVAASWQTACGVTLISSLDARKNCLCASLCDHKEKAYVQPGGDDFSNDRSTFLYQRFLDTDTLVLELLKNGVVVDALDGDYGVFYDFGDLDNADISGITLSWEAVQAAYGYGFYTVRATLTSIGGALEMSSHCFHLLPWDECHANKSVKIESYLSGCINEYIDLGSSKVYQSTRIEGRMSMEKPDFETINYKKSDRTKKQIQDKVIYNFKLITRALPEAITEYINLNHLLSDEIYITDYNQYNAKVYTKYPVVFAGFKIFEEFTYLNKSAYVYQFQDKVERYIKSTKCK